MKQKIKLIIEVDQKYYEACKDAVEESYPSQIEEIIANGTPYNPTGDLISREALKEALGKSTVTIIGYGKAVFLDKANELIDNAPTVSPLYAKAYKCGYEAGKNERPQGEWVYRQEWFDDEKEPRMAWGCNQCGFSIKSVHEKRNFCPNCGADMKGGAE